MKILLAPDSFKGALSASAAAAAMERGFRRVWGDIEYVHLPVADGGEGTLDALVDATGGRRIDATVTGPMGQPVLAQWGLLGDGDTAVIELALAAGLPLVRPDERNPKVASTFGVGELILEAARTPAVSKLLIGLGGSATNDGGSGILQALGVNLVDVGGEAIPRGGAGLLHLVQASREYLKIDTTMFEVRIACDVANPLVGPNGASAVFGPQKGASDADIALLDRALSQFAAVLEINGSIPGFGAAGGATAGLKWLFPNAELRPGIDIVLDCVNFDNHLAGADFVFTGEGRLDAQTLGGKAIAGVAGRARRANVPVGAVVGSLDPDLELGTLKQRTGVAAVIPLAPGPCTLDESIRNTARWIEDAAERAANWISL